MYGVVHSSALALLRFYKILQKKFNVNVSACVKFHVENEWEISRMCEIDVWRLAIFFCKIL